MSNGLYVIAGVYLIAMGYFLKTTPGESGPFVSGDERVKQVATPAKRIIVIAFGLLMLVYGVYEVVQARARAHRDHATQSVNASATMAGRVIGSSHALYAEDRTGKNIPMTTCCVTARQYGTASS